jgi:hypothetical protein
VLSAEAKSSENAASLSLCRKIVEWHQLVEKMVPSARAAEGVKDSWTTWAEGMRVSFTDEVLTGHRFEEEWKQFTQSPRGRMTPLVSIP